jgi:lipoyl(octanoyl) transferase
MNKEVRFEDLGRKDYKETWNYQERLFDDILFTKIKNRREEAGLETQNHLLFVEHDHVYTLGKSGELENLLAGEQLLERIGAKFYKINRVVISLITVLVKLLVTPYWI